MDIDNRLGTRHHEQRRHELAARNFFTPLTVFSNMPSPLTATPLRLAAITFAGSALSVAGFITVRPHRDSLPYMIACVAMVVVGAGLAYWVPYQLREDIRNERWTEAEVAPLKNVLEHPATRVLMFILIIAMIATLFVQHAHRPYFWAVFLLLQTISQLSNAVRTPYRQPTGPARIDWNQVAPLRSDHWGER